MVEVFMTCYFVPGIDEQTYGEFAEKSIEKMSKALGLVEIRPNRNSKGSSYLRAITVWENYLSWANFVESDEWKAIEADLRKFYANIKFEIWGSSPVLPEPLRQHN